jgi:hypothetical protein
MPAAPTLSTSITAGGTGHIADSNTAHGILNKSYLVDVANTKTAAYTLVLADSGEVIWINAATTVAITVPVLAAGVSCELVRYHATGSFTLTASGTTLRVPTGATATPRVQYSSLSLLYRTASEVLVGGDLT